MNEQRALGERIDQAWDSGDRATVARLQEQYRSSGFLIERVSTEPIRVAPALFRTPVGAVVTDTQTAPDDQARALHAQLTPLPDPDRARRRGLTVPAFRGRGRKRRRVARDQCTSSVTNTYHVETHDVAILSFVVPTKAKVGKAAVINVGVGNTRYPETVHVTLCKLTPQGNVVVDTQTATVPVMTTKKSMNLMFSYTLTDDDLAVGKVTFQATANIGPRDTVPGDNK